MSHKWMYGLLSEYLIYSGLMVIQNKQVHLREISTAVTCV